MTETRNASPDTLGGGWAFAECAETARRYARSYQPASDGRNTFIMFAEWADKRAEECALAEPTKEMLEAGKLAGGLLFDARARDVWSAMNAAASTSTCGMKASSGLNETLTPPINDSGEGEKPSARQWRAPELCKRAADGLDALLDDNARLRAALQVTADIKTMAETGSCPNSDDSGVLDEVIEAARQALPHHTERKG